MFLPYRIPSPRLDVMARFMFIGNWVYLFILDAGLRNSLSITWWALFLVGYPLAGVSFWYSVTWLLRGPIQRQRIWGTKGRRTRLEVLR